MKVLIAGDYAPRDRINQLLERENYETVFGEVKSVLSEVDYSIVNLEAPVISGQPTPIEKTGPNLSCTPKAVESLNWVGFNCVTLANNHFRDQGEQGVYETISSCEKCGINYVGGGGNLEEASKILYQEIDRKVLAIVNICENEWSIASENHGGSSPLNPTKNYYQIQEARNEADYVLVIVHGGIEGYQFPTPRMQETYRFFIDAGADAIVNHHQHCYSGYEVYKGKPIFYGLGNFCFDRNKERGSKWNEGYMVIIQFADSNVNYRIIPFTQCDEKPAVVLMDEEKKSAFTERISQINKTIIDPKEIYLEFQKKVDSLYEYRLLALEPFNSRIINLLQQKCLFPRLIKRKQRKSMLVRISCESNRETLIWVLKKYFKLK